MTVAVACTVPDGVILGVDSAVTIGDAGNPEKVYEDAEKIFQLGNRPVGIAIYGLASFGVRTIGSLLREFELKNPSGVLDENKGNIKDIVEQMRIFFSSEYTKTVVPVVEAVKGVPFAQIPDTDRPGLGLIVAGFSPGMFSPEVWNIVVPLHSAPNSGALTIGSGNLGSAWFASCTPIFRYVKGRDPALLDAIMEKCEEIHGSPFTEDQKTSVREVADKSEYQIVFNSMPLKRGIEYVRFLVQLVISHHRFAVGAPIVGGCPRVGLVTYKGEGFKILEDEVEYA
jgi:hypothetical protein